MKVKELIAMLEKFDGNMEVMFVGNTEYAVNIGSCKAYKEDDPDNDRTDTIIGIEPDIGGCFIKPISE